MVEDTTAALLPELALASRGRPGDGVRLHVVEGGPSGGSPVVLLHGFPDFWYGWRNQLPALLEAGHRVLVPDLRGYNRSEAPSGIGAYRLSRFSRDVARLLEAAGHDRAHLVGHDWGGAVAWDLATRWPSLVDRLCVVNMPHPRVFREAVLGSPRQLRRSWYVGFFQLPRLPEWALARRDGAGLARILRASSRPEAFAADELAAYRAAWRTPGTVRAMVDAYRAAVRRTDLPPVRAVEPPTLLLWGCRDAALVEGLAPASLEWCADGRLETYRTGSHWVHMEETEAVTGAICEHLAGPDAGP